MIKELIKLIRVFENAEKYNVRIRFGLRSQINDSKFIGYNESSFANLPKVGRITRRLHNSYVSKQSKRVLKCVMA